MAKKSKKRKKAKKTKKKKTLPKVKIEKIKKTKIRVIGIGGGGSSIVSEIASKMKKASFVIANTDRQALKTANQRAIRFQFGQALTQGLGTGMNPELGEMAAQNEKEKIKKLLEGQDFCILVVSLGGGAGSGAAPIFAKISRSLGNITLGICTLPFKFEGEKKMEIAKTALEKLKPKLNAITIIPNERVFQIIDKKTPLKQALSAINKSLAESLEGLIETIYQPGLINIDFADLRTILEGHGKLAYLNTVEVQKKEGSTDEAIKKVLNNFLYPYSIRGAKGILLNIVGEKNLRLAEVNQISRTISDLVSSGAKIIFGVAQNRKHSDSIRTTLLATGCTMRVPSDKSKKKRKKRKKKVIPKPTPLVEKKETKQKKRRKRKKARAKKSKTVPSETGKELNQAKALSISKPPETKVKVQIRKNALQIKKEAEEAEREMLEKERVWETPAFLRRQKKT